MAKKKSLVEKVLDAASGKQERPEQEQAEVKAPKGDSKAVKVRATALGYYGNMRRRPGDVFYLKPFMRVFKKINPSTKKEVVEEKYISAIEQFSEEWMELADKNEKLVSQPPQKSFGKHSMPEESMGAARDVNDSESGSGDQEVI